ncbi:polymorphic toxin-type HINT domain-containing protein [Streptomyces nymphaeiformis]|uniref:RHS repeat-associated protein n=1 Tax=Streptomyces nymphaeiformis TaxID=2663842 RepID=A0A7W7XDU7_9ACTN|nr:polymorphic toxin-type HINT domain-containing protein [Streptomyces nymphaeiformis]MBB4985114.1 RHS repeat-associated protein [Streptomyces nymphaeiformis]
MPKTKSVNGTDYIPTGLKRRPKADPPWQAPPVTWPAAATQQLTVDAGVQNRVTVGGVPVRLGRAASHAKKTSAGSDRLELAVKDRATAQKAGVDGLLMSLRDTDSASASSNRLDVEIDYTAIRGAYAAGWSSRLRLVTLPACALTTPEKPECRKQTPLATENDTKNHTLSATLTTAGSATPQVPATGAAAKTSATLSSLAMSTSGATVLAATAGASGSEGSFKATSLSASGSWSAEGNSGGFGWSVPIDVPTAPGGLVPKIALSYNSSAIDGRTASTNNQPSWIGEGWEYSPGFIERRYASCENDKQGGNNTANTGDLCWKSENATLSLNGSSNELVWDAAKSTWKLEGDDGSRIERVYDSEPNNSGDEDSEYWKVTTTDGTQYWFGKNRLPGWATGETETNSVFTVPVYGNHTGEQGHADDYASSAEQQGWRWSLDYVVDPHGNAMALYYTKEQGYYAQNSKIDDPKSYTRGGYLNRIDYGLRAGAVYTTTNPAGRVTFTTGNRCTATDCTFDKAHATSWPDTPVDLNCTSGTECLQGAPSFWSKQRLTSINTYSLVGSTLQPVDMWALTQSFPATGDTSTPSLWLDSVQRTAKAGALADITLNPTVFDGELMANRVDAAEGRPALNRKRITSITNETGGQTLVTYHPTDCTPTTLPTEDNNSKRCYPSWWTPDGYVDPVKDWFHKYLVWTVTETDTTGGSGSESKTTSYNYANGPYWRRDTSEFTLDKHRSWNVYRGYGTVRTYTGTTNRVKTENTYYLGMAGDTLANGTPRTVATINGITDREDFVGRVASSATYDKNGTDGKIVIKTTYTPWESAATATQTVKGITDPDKPNDPAPTLQPKTAYLAGTATEKASALLDNGTWRTLTTNRTFDSTYGLLLKESDDGAGTVEARCTYINYVTPDTSDWLIAYPSEVVSTDNTNCLSRPNETTGQARTYYDNQALGAAPELGKANPTRTEQLSEYKPDLTPVWDTVVQASHDQYGRVVTLKGQDGQPVTTTYAPATGAQPTTISVTNVKNHTTSTTFDGMRGLTLTAKDANNRTSSSEYDALGRLTKGWSTGRATTEQPNATITYNLSNSIPSTVTTKKLYENGTWGTSTTFYDSLLRARQTQTDAIGTTGRVVSETFYDNHGRAYLTNAPFYNSAAVSNTMLVVTPNQIPQALRNEYDGRGRIIESVQLSLNVEKWRTSTTYGDYWTASVPPAGGTATLTLADVRGRTVEERQYKDRNPLIGAAATQYEKTTRSYDKAGLLAAVTDTSKRNSWTYTYDLRGRPTGTTDPDKGASSTHYNTDGRVDTVSDSRGTLATTYDELGRKTSLRTGSVTGTKLAEWTYDMAGGLGLPATSTRYDSSITANAAYKTAVKGYDSTGQPTGTTVTIPSVTGEELLAGTYTVATTATPVSGLPETAAYSTTNTNATTHLPAETVTNHFGSQDMLGIVDGTLSQVYLRGAGYTPFGELAQAQLGNLGRLVTQTNTYEESTRRLITSKVDREATGPATPSSITYSYDPVGNITSIRDAQDDGASLDQQCFTYDWARRITEAWTTGDACATKPVNGTGIPNLGTVEPYWTSWTFTDTGQRATETLHKAGAITADTTRTYAYPTTAGAAQAHGVRTVTATGGVTGTDTYTYDTTGNLIKKAPANAGPVQDLTWNEEGKLATSTISGKTTSFLYDAEGTRIIKRDPTTTTLYLPGGQELALTRKVGTTPAVIAGGTRYYTVPGGSAIRTSNDGKVRLLVADHHNTNTLSFSATTLTFNRRRTLPYGGQRGAAPAFWPGQKGFVDGDIDSTTGFTHIGARDYDTSLGQFISADPLFEIDKPQTLNGYSYTVQNPITFSDPTGLGIDDGTGHTERPGKKKGEGTGVPRGTNAGTNSSDSEGSGGSDAGQLGDSGIYLPVEDDEEAPDGFFATFNAELPKRTAQWKKETGDDKLPRDQIAALGMEVCSDLGTCTDAQMAYLYDVYVTPILKEAPEWAMGGGRGVAAGPGLRRVIESIKSRKGISSAAGCPPNSFTPDTLVLMADGTTKRIEDVRKGDRVLATDPETGETRFEEVTAEIKGHGTKKMVKVTIDIDGDSGTATASVTATDGHPFWVPELGEWIEATDLQEGSWLQVAREGSYVQVESIKRWTATEATVYNLTVESLHTYYVLAGQTPVLVHNSTCPTGAANGEKLRRQLAEEAGQLPGIRSADDIFDTPSTLRGGVTPDQVKPFFEGKPGWRQEGLGRGKNAGGGWVIREYTDRGNPTGRMLRWNPGGGHHGDGAYWRVVGPEGDLGGIIR